MLGKTFAMTGWPGALTGLTGFEHFMAGIEMTLWGRRPAAISVWI